MAKINLRESVDKLDRETFCKYDLLNMYDCCNFSDKDKVKLVEMFTKGNKKLVTKFIKEAFEKKYNGVQMICNPSPADFNASMGEDFENYQKPVKVDILELKGMSESEIKDYLDSLPLFSTIRNVKYKRSNSNQEVSIIKDIEGKSKLHPMYDIPASSWVFDFGPVQYPEKTLYFILNDMHKNMEVKDKNKQINESGAHDIEDDQYFTREDLDEFVSYVIEEIEGNLNVKNVIEIYDGDIDGNILSLTLSFEGYEEQYRTRIDMRKIRVPSDLVRRYADEVIEYFTSKFQEAIDNEDIVLDESGALAALAGTAVASAASGFGSAVGDRLMDKILPEDVNDLEHRVITTSQGKKFSVNIRNGNSIDFEADVQMIHPYDNAHYIWAKIEADKRVWFIRNSIVLERTNAYKVSFWPEDYETTDEYINDFIYDVAEDLVEMNSDVEERIDRS